MRTSLFFLVSGICLLSSRAAYGQDRPMEWGKISRAELSMSAYPRDTNAAALVLCDYGESYVNDDLELTFFRHLRIKIFSREGFSWGNHAVSLYTKDRVESILNIRGATYTLGSDSAIVKHDLEDNAIFEEKVNDEHTRIRMTLPALQAGCIIEVSYEVICKYIDFPREWEFQSSIPTLWSEYRLRTPKYFAFAPVTSSFEPFFANEFREMKHRFSRAAASYGAEQDCYEYRWVIRNAPALKEEPYMTTLRDYTARVRIQLSEYALLNGGSKRVLKSWPEVTEELLDNDHFGGKLSPTKAVRRLTDTVTAGLTTPDEKLSAIYDYVRKTIVWDGETWMFADRDVEDVLELRKGNSAEMNFLLLSMLRSAGFAADPVILSTRSNGRLAEIYPILTQFNAVLTRVTIGNTSRFLDPTDPLRGVDMPPAAALNVRGFVIKEGPEEWVTINPTKKYIHRSIATISVKPGGEIEGTLESLDDGYSALARRRDLREKSDEEVAKELFELEKKGVSLDSVMIEGKDSLGAPIHLSAHGSSATYAQAAGDLIYLNPFILDRVSSNPFKLPDRKFSVDMSYGRELTAVTNVVVPEGYDVKEFPENVTASVGRNDASFSLRTAVDGRYIQVLAKLATARVEFPATMYKQLKEFYDQIVVGESAQIVLQRRESASSVGRPAKAPTRGKRK